MRRRPGEVRDAIIQALVDNPAGASVEAITSRVSELIGDVAPSSVRSYLRLKTPELFARMDRAQYVLNGLELLKGAPSNADVSEWPTSRHGNAKLVLGDCLHWLEARESNSVEAVVTDPPYGLLEYSEAQQEKLRARKGGIWRIPPSFDGSVRSPLPRFTVLTANDLASLDQFILLWATRLKRVLVPGANVVVASNPLVSHVVSGALSRAGLERRGEIVRLVMTMRGGDRPKHAHIEFANVSVMPRSMWEPWLLFRKPLDGRVQDNLRKWGVGGFRRTSETRPFGDVIQSSPTRAAERKIAPHPSLKPQAFLRKIVRGVLPLGKGVVLDPFAGAASTLAAAEAIGYASIGIEKDPKYFEIGASALPRLAQLRVDAPGKAFDDADLRRAMPTRQKVRSLVR